MSTPSDDLVLHLIWTDWENMPCLISPDSLKAAQRATDDDAPHPPMYMRDLRRPGYLDDLDERLDGYFGVSVEQYVSAIEAAAGKPPEDGDQAARLAALADFEFAGADPTTDDDEGLPADDDYISEDDVAWGEPAVRYWNVISKATGNDLPSDLAERYSSHRYADDRSGASGAHIGSFADPDRLDQLIAELETRGYAIHRRSKGVVNRECMGL